MFTALPAQGVKVGSVDFGKVTFITMAGAKKDSRTSCWLVPRWMSTVLGSANYLLARFVL